jgi:predicted dehydrogenase
MWRGAIIGFGNVAEFGHWPAYVAHPAMNIVAVVDPSAERRAQAKSQQSSLGVFASIAELEEETLDFVDICTPPARHAEPMQEAFARGWHVLCEKPFLLDQTVLEQVRAEARRRDLAVIPVHNWKYAPIVRSAAAQLRRGDIGELREVEITTLRIRDAAAADPLRPNWRRDPVMAGGGILMDHGWHAVYLALDFFGEAVAQTSAKLHHSSENAVEDEAIVDLQFPSGTARIELSWNASRRTNLLRLTGTRGQIVIDDDTLESSGGRTRFASGLSAGSHHPDWFAAMLPDVLAALHHPELSHAPFEEAALCLRIIQGCYESAGSARPRAGVEAALPNDR